MAVRGWPSEEEPCAGPRWWVGIRKSFAAEPRWWVGRVGSRESLAPMGRGGGGLMLGGMWRIWSLLAHLVRQAELGGWQ